jgi:hypothetical protein
LVDRCRRDSQKAPPTDRHIARFFFEAAADASRAVAIDPRAQALTKKKKGTHVRYAL